MEMKDRIKERRILLGFTQEELAERVGLQKSAIAKYENGRVENIKRSMILKMAEVLECAPCYLLGLDDSECTDNDIAIPKEDEELINRVVSLLRSLSDTGRTQVEDFANSVLKVENMQKQVQEPQLLAAHKIENTGMTDEELAKADADDLELLKKFHDMDAKTE